MYYIIGVLEGAAIPDEVPNRETLEAMQELEDGGGEFLELSRIGTHSDLFR